MIRLLLAHCFFGLKNDALYLGVNYLQMLIFQFIVLFDYLITLYFTIFYAILYADLVLHHLSLVLFQQLPVSCSMSPDYSFEVKRLDQNHSFIYFVFMKLIFVYQRTLFIAQNRMYCFTYFGFLEQHLLHNLSSKFQLVQTHQVRRQCYLHHLQDYKRLFHLQGFLSVYSPLFILVLQMPHSNYYFKSFMND